MSVLWIVLPIAFIFAGFAVAAFMWTVRTGQLDDLETPASRILFEDNSGIPKSDASQCVGVNRPYPTQIYGEAEAAGIDDFDVVPQQTLDICTLLDLGLLEGGQGDAADT